MVIELFSNTLLVGASFAIAFLIGATSIGGMLLAPALNMVGEVPIHMAIPSCMFAFIFAGVIGAVFFSRGGAKLQEGLVELMLGAGVGAFAGSLVLAYLPAIVIQLVVAAVCIASGMRFVLVRRRYLGSDPSVRPAKRLLFIIGIVTGVGSALTGTGGPMILMPCLMALRVDIKRAVGLAHLIQIPIGILATAGNFLLGRMDFSVALPMSATVVVGAGLGAIFAQRVSTRVLGQSVAVLLVASGVAYALKTIGFL